MSGLSNSSCFWMKNRSERSREICVKSEYSSHVPKIKKGKSTIAGSSGNRDLAKLVNLSASTSNSAVLFHQLSGLFLMLNSNGRFSLSLRPKAA